MCTVCKENKDGFSHAQGCVTPRDVTGCFMDGLGRQHHSQITGMSHVQYEIRFFQVICQCLQNVECLGESVLAC